MSEWIPVSERLPDEEKAVLAYWPVDGLGEDPLMETAWVSEGNQWRDFEGELKPPTHWMPLPEPPRAKTGH